MILLSYIGVHQIFQLALAAEEMGALEVLHCSLVDKPGKWGARLARWWSPPSVRAAGIDALPKEKLFEHPLPLLANRLAGRLPLPGRRDHLLSNTWFDHRVARAVTRSRARIFVGVETCALASMRAARARGMTCILDCPGVPVWFLDEQARRAAAELGLPPPPPANSAGMLRRKRAELALADLILCCSDFQAGELRALGVPECKIRVVPLWADSAFWSVSPRQTKASTPNRRLRVLFAGTISLKKGAPYVIEAMRQTGARAECLLVGRSSSELRGLLSRLPDNCRLETYLPKEELRQIYAEHDVLVMPSLGDSFGFVGMEAMAAGLPVIASASAGVPLPDPAWRVPTRDAAAIAARLEHYLDCPEALAHDSRTARAFAAVHTLERYRRQIQHIYQELLAARPPAS